MHRISNKKRILNIDLANVSFDELLSTARRGIIFTPNIDHFVLLQKDHVFYSAYKNADYVVLDSQVVFLMSKFLHSPFKEKISGADLLPRFCDYHKNDKDVKIFVLGGMDDVSEIVKKKINERCRREIIIGSYSPSYGFERNQKECDDIIETINTSGANVLVVGLGTPKQEKWIFHNRSKCRNINLFMGVGAALDFIAGIQTRAPMWMQRIGMEWMYRLLQNPRRLARRYLLTDIQYFYYFTLDMMKIYKDPFEGKK